MSRSFLSVADLSPTEIRRLLDRAAALKRTIRARKETGTLSGRVVGVLFEKPSTRTRTSFETAVLRLGGSPVYLSANELQLSRGEPVKDTARILGSYLDCLVARVYSHSTLVELAKFSGVPVVNALSDVEHPTQALSDLLTIREAKGGLEGVSLAYVGDGNNVCNSLMLACALTGMEFRAACPDGYEPDRRLLKKAESFCRASGGGVSVVKKPTDAATGADLLYTDVWVSMGEEAEKERRLADFRGYQINSELLRHAKKDVLVMHCLPAHRGLEITDQVLEGRRSIVWEQGENKLYGAAATLEWLLGPGASRRS